MISGLTKQQQKALAFIEIYCELHDGVSPSYEEIAGALELHSKSGVHRIIHALEERGFISRIKDRSRSITIVKKFCKNCGAPIS